MTAKQRAARAKFKAVVAEAKKLRKKNPKLTQAQAVKQAWAIDYAKNRAGKKLGYSKERQKIHKAATKEIKRSKKRNPDRSKKEVLSLAYQNAPFSSVGATKVKAKKRRSTEMHTDTKSHNVNIRVMSGINNQYIKDLKEIDNQIQKWLVIQHGYKNALHNTKDKLSKTLIRNDLYRIKNVISELKERMNKIKKHIK